MMKIRRISALLLIFLTLFLIVFEALRGGKYRSYRAAEQVRLPVLSISTEKGAKITDTETYLRAKLELSGTEEGKFDLSDVSCSVRGRGNSTWDFCDKKSYKIKLDRKENLLGIGKGGEKDWALLANAREKSMLRNYAIFAFARNAGMEPVPSCTFVQVMLNGEYVGLYLLCETVETAKNRLDIGDSGGEEDIGYLLELDKRAKSDAEHSYEYFYVNDWKIPFAVKSHIENTAQRDYIKAYMEKADDAILDGNREKIEELVDLPSLVDLYLIEEFSKDRDVGFSSLFMYKKAGGKLYFGDPWDFDMALGNDTGEDRIAEGNEKNVDYSSPEGLVAAKLNRWFEALMKEEWFVSAAANRWFELTCAYEKMFEETAKTGFSIVDEAEKNYDRWQIMGKKQLFEPLKIVLITEYRGQVEYLLNFMEERKEWLDDYFSGKVK